MSAPFGGSTGADHGGSLDAARRRFPGWTGPWLDLSTGINPVPYPLPSPDDADAARLPEPAQLGALCAVAAAAYGAAPGFVVAAPGTQVLIGVLPWLFPARTVSILSPTYAEHAIAWAATGAAVIPVVTLAALGDADVGVLVHPNNPDGRRHEAPALRAVADRLAARGGMLVVDESFADLEPPGFSMAGLLPHPALVVLRSFGKTYGLAGLRLGFALTDAARAARLRTVFGPWPVGGGTLRAGLSALRDRAWLDTARRNRSADAARLDAMLVAAGLRVQGGTPLFRLAQTPAAAAWYAGLGRRGILVRRFADHPHWLRFGLPGTAEAWQTLTEAFTEQESAMR